MRTFCFSLILSITFFACDSSKNEEAYHPIEGTWKMVALQDVEGNNIIPSVYTQIKIFTRERLFLVNYIEDGGRFAMALGGPYSVRRDSFVETIGFYSEDPSFVGTAIPYAFSGDPNHYHQSGVIIAEDENAEDLLIEEDYERLEPALSAVKGENPLIGVWKLQKAAYDQMESPLALPDGEETYKVITPSYFYVVQSNSDNGKFSGMVFGSHEIKGGQYLETIISTSRDSMLSGWQLAFDYEVSESSFSQSTIVNQEPYQDYRIEEHFHRVE